MYDISPSAFVRACRRVLTTSKGFTAKAAKEPAAHPERNEHQNTASPKNNPSINEYVVRAVSKTKNRSPSHANECTRHRLCLPDPSDFLGPSSLRLANRGKYMTEKETSLNMVAPVPLYKPRIPCCFSSPMASSVAEVLSTVLFTAKRKTFSLITVFVF